MRFSWEKIFAFLELLCYLYQDFHPTRIPFVFIEQSYKTKYKKYEPYLDRCVSDLVRGYGIAVASH